MWFCQHKIKINITDHECLSNPFQRDTIESSTGNSLVFYAQATVPVVRKTGWKLANWHFWSLLKSELEILWEWFKAVSISSFTVWPGRTRFKLLTWPELLQLCLERRRGGRDCDGHFVTVLQLVKLEKLLSYHWLLAPVGTLFDRTFLKSKIQP